MAQGYIDHSQISHFLDVSEILAYSVAIFHADEEGFLALVP